MILMMIIMIVMNMIMMIIMIIDNIINNLSLSLYKHIYIYIYIYICMYRYIIIHRHIYLGHALRGVSVHHLSTELLEQICGAGLGRESSVYEVFRTGFTTISTTYAAEIHKRCCFSWMCISLETCGYFSCLKWNSEMWELRLRGSEPFWKHLYLKQHSTKKAVHVMNTYKQYICIHIYIYIYIYIYKYSFFVHSKSLGRGGRRAAQGQGRSVPQGRLLLSLLYVLYIAINNSTV